ncbi:MAG: DUF4296 domain-containing protein [Chitinophagales bacterium]|nr:DUF4296 domain-containing protein [Chitinophagales bacterium]
MLHIRAKLHNPLLQGNRLLFLLLLLFAGCQPKPGSDEGKNAITRKKMVAILVDVHLMESRAEGLGIHKDSLKAEYKQAYADIFKKHQVKEQDFKTTFKWYEANPAKLDLLYQDVVAELSSMEANAKAAKPKEPK